MSEAGDLVRAAAALERAADDPAAAVGVAPELVQRLLAAAVRLYACVAEARPEVTPFPAAGTPAPTPTDVCRTSGRMLDALSIEVFELAMWNSWSSRA